MKLKVCFKKKCLYSYSSIYKKKNNVFCCYAVNTYVNFKTNSTITTTSTRYIVLTNCKRKTRKKIAYSYYISTASVWRQRRRKKEKKCQRPFFESAFFMFSAPVSLYSCSIQFYPISILILSIFLIQLFKNRSAITGPVTVYQHDENLEKT